MAKRFKQKFSKVIPSFQSCRSKDPSTLPSNPVPSFFRLSTVNSNSKTIINLHDLPLPPPQQPPSRSHHSSIKRHVSLALISMGCGSRSRPSPHYLSETNHTKSPPPAPQFHWKKEDKWHVVAKIYDDMPRRKIYTSSVSGDSHTSDVLLPPPPPPNTEKRKRRVVKKKKMIPRIALSTSSAESGLFSSEGLEDDDVLLEDEETETLVSSSRSYSTDSSLEFNPQLETIRESPFTNRRTRKKKVVKNPRRRVGSKNGGKGKAARKSCESMSPARLSKFQWLIPCTVEGKVRESFAVVKKSEDPYEDFKRSMMEMIMEKQMFEERDLEQLLHCFLSLNSRNHHGVIVKAFSDIWEALFCRKSVAYRVSTTF